MAAPGQSLRALAAATGCRFSVLASRASHASGPVCCSLLLRRCYSSPAPRACTNPTRPGREDHLAITPYDPPRSPLSLSTGDIYYSEEFSSNYDAATAQTIVCIHGCPGGSYDFRYLGPAICGNLNARLIRFDVPGHGLSPSTTTKSASGEGLTNCIAEAIRLLIPKKETTPVTIVAHSLGAEIALHLANFHPECVDNTVLISPVSLRPHKAVRPMEPLRKPIAWFQETAVGRILVPPLTRYVWTKIMGFSERNTTEEFLWGQKRVSHIEWEYQGVLANNLRESGHPVLFCYGTKDKLIEEQVFLEFCDALALQADSICAYDTGHMTPKFSARAIADDIIDFIHARRES